MHPYIFEKLLEQKRNEMLAEAARQRLLAPLRRRQAKLWGRLLFFLGNQLVSYGRRLQNRYGVVLQLPDEAGQACVKAAQCGGQD